ncbi:efflux RND transporter periplasmic adaptor subunit [Pinisolibacter sp.]|uniref:efflux RND transporter periplasmic adaptor subunit n=1 Tax=Pinisolibacter sp. TaxID=2172024 RepID=UPI002FDCEA17
MWKRMLLMLLAVGVVFGGLAGFQIFRTGMIAKMMAEMANPRQTVATADARQEAWADRFSAIGSLRAKDGAELALEASGIVDAIAFSSGERVEAGKVLLKLKSDDDAARLEALQATLRLGQINYDRDVEQLKIKAVAQATVDADAANLRNAKAQVDAQRAAIEKKTLKAPFSGRLGIRSVDLGQFLPAGTAIVTLQALDPIHIDFFLPQQALAQIKAGQPIAARVDTWPNEVFEGAVTAINPKVDTATRNVQIRATLQNPGERLLPGMFARVEITVGAPKSVITLPLTAITSNPYGDTAFVVEGEAPEQTVRQIFVKTGETRGDVVAIVAGIEAGQTVVTAGQLKLHKGSPVTVDNSIVPTADPAPTPVDK